MVVGEVISGWKDIFRDIRDPEAAEARRAEEQTAAFLGRGTPEYQRAMYGERWQPSHITKAGDIAQQKARAFMTAEDKRIRKAHNIYLQQQAEIARARQQAQKIAIQERQKAIEERKIQQQARRTGRTIIQIRQEKRARAAEQLKVITTAGTLRGQQLTRLQTQRALGGAAGVVALRRGTAAERAFFRRTEISPEQARRRIIEAKKLQPKLMQLKDVKEEKRLLGKPRKFTFDFGKPVEIIPGLTTIEAKEKLRKKGLKGKVAAEFIPVTALETGIIFGTAAIFPTLPVAARIGVSGTIAALEVPKVFDPTLPKEQRIASGIIGVAATVGIAAEAIPFAKGTLARISPKYKPVKVQVEGFKAVTKVKGIKRIGLISRKAPLKIGITKDIKLPKTSPLRRGGFGVRPSEKALYLGKQDVATSQIGLFKKGKEIKLTREFFVTPAEPTLKIPETRISRLGLAEPLKFQKIREIKLALGIPRQPQIGIERGALVTRAGRGRAYRLGRGTELEAIKIPKITDVKEVGVTAIKGQAVKIFTFKTEKIKAVKDITIPKTPSIPKTRVSAEATFAAPLGLKSLLVKEPKITTAKPSKVKIPTIKTIITKPTIIITPITPTRRPPTKITPPRIPKITTTIPKITKLTLPKTPIISPRVTRVTPPRIQRVPSIIPPTKIPRKIIPKAREKRIPKGLYVVSVRRFGKFIPIGKLPSLSKAFAVGRRKVSRTLAASFRVTGPKISERLPRGFYRSRKEPGVFIEKRKFRLSKLPEIKEIQFYKKRKMILA